MEQILIPMSLPKIGSSVGKFAWLAFIFGKGLLLVIIHHGGSFLLSLSKKCENVHYFRKSLDRTGHVFGDYYL